MSLLSFQWIMTLGIVLGVALSVAIPYFRKLYEGKIESFDYKYLKQAVFAGIWSNAVSFQLWLDWEQPDGISMVFAFILAMAFGYGGKDAQDQVYKYIKRTKAII